MNAPLIVEDVIEHVRSRYGKPVQIGKGRLFRFGSALVRWMSQNVIAKAFEIEATTMIYSGLLRLNDLVLSQPNNRIELYVAAAKAKRETVRAQFTRPSFQALAPRCHYISFEFIEEQFKRLEAFSIEDGNARVSGLITGERFDLPGPAIDPRER